MSLQAHYVLHNSRLRNGRSGYSAWEKRCEDNGDGLVLPLTPCLAGAGVGSIIWDPLLCLYDMLICYIRSLWNASMFCRLNPTFWTPPPARHTGVVSVAAWSVPRGNLVKEHDVIYEKHSDCAEDYRIFVWAEPHCAGARHCSRIWSMCINCPNGARAGAQAARRILIWASVPRGKALQRTSWLAAERKFCIKEGRQGLSLRRDLCLLRTDRRFAQLCK